MLLRDAVESTGRVYVRLSSQSNADAVAVRPGRFSVLRTGAGGTVIAVGPMLDPVLAATSGLDVTVLYAATVRPFDSASLLGTLGAANVVIVEPYLAGTSSRLVSDALVAVPHRLLGLGVRADELRRYGTAEDHARAHGLNASALRGSIQAFLGAERA
jgi:transketolase